MKTTRIDVTSERGTYPVIIGAGALSRLAALLDRQAIGHDRLVVTSPKIWRLQGQRVRGLVGRGQQPVMIAAGEGAKTLANVARLYEAAARRRLDRSAAIVAFGGGVIGDMAGFAAATWLRGIGIVQVPTTLLAQVDSSIGGKTGVNLPSGKNLVGSFYSPSLVVCDPEVLGSLSRREFRAGLYEVVKYGIISSGRLFDRVRRELPAILDHEPAVLARIVTDCCRIKADVVMSDEREAGPRRILNFGHTVGHALEALTGYRRFRHGEAVGYGMLAAARLSCLRGALSESDEHRIRDLMAALGRLPTVGDLKAQDALEAISRDKKVVRGRLHFVLAASIGSTVIVNDVTTRELVHVMKAIGMRA